MSRVIYSSLIQFAVPAAFLLTHCGPAEDGAWHESECGSQKPTCGAVLTTLAGGELTPREASEYLAERLEDVREIFFKNQVPISGFGLPISSTVKVAKGSGINAEQWVSRGENGVAVTQAVLRLREPNTTRFVLLHELGHLLTRGFMQTLGVSELTGPQLEIVADLAAAYLMHVGGASWEEVMDSVASWRSTWIFDARWNHGHPPGADRVRLIGCLVNQMQRRDKSFLEATRHVLGFTAKYNAPARLPRLTK